MATKRQKKHALAGSGPTVVGDGNDAWPYVASRAVATVDGNQSSHVAKIVGLMMTTMLKYWPKTRNT